MATVIFCLAAVMMDAYEKRDKVISASIVSEACTDSVCSEDIWLRRNGDELAEIRAGKRFEAVGRLSSKRVEISRKTGVAKVFTEDDVTAACDEDKSIEIRDRDPENYMRAMSLWEDRNK